MVEMTVGSRFYYKDKLCEVVELKGRLCEVAELKGGYMCKGCIFLAGTNCKCKKSKCYSDERHDGKNVYFKEVKE